MSTATAAAPATVKKNRASRIGHIRIVKAFPHSLVSQGINPGEYVEAYICPMCGHHGMVSYYSDRGVCLLRECPVCGFWK